MYRLERDWAPRVDTILYGRSKEQIAKARKDLKDSLMTIAPIFAEMPFFMSEEFTLVDCCLASILWRLKLMEVDLGKSKQVQPLFGYMEGLFARQTFKEGLRKTEKERKLDARPY